MTHIFQRVAALALILLASLAAMPGCQSAEPEKKSVKIGVCAYKQADTYISTILSAMEKICKDHEQRTGIKVNLEISYAKESQRAQNEQIQRYISLEYDVICVNIVDRTTAAPVIDSAIAAGIPLVFFNREPVESDIMRGENIYYVGSDAKTTAVYQGEIIADAYSADPYSLDRDRDGRLEYYMLEGEMGHQDAIIRTEWSVRTLADRDIPIEKLQGGVANWDRNQAAALVEQWISKSGGDVELILCNNDDMALGAADALEKHHISGVAIVGIDATSQGLEAVRKGRLLGTVDCNPTEHARCIFELAFNLGLGNELPPDVSITDERYVRVELRKVTGENVDKLE